MSRQRRAGWMFVLASALSLIRLSAAEELSELKIGLLAPPQEADALSVRQGAVIGVELANQLAGPKVSLVVRGRPGQWGTEGDEAAVLGLDEAVGGMIAPPSGSASHQVMQIAGRTRIPVATLCADSSVSGSGIPWVVRMVPRSNLEAEAIFRGITNAAAAKSIRWAAMVPDGRAGREATKDLRKAAQNVGVTLREPVSLPAKEEEWGSDIRKALADPPQGILLWTDAVSAGKLAMQLRERGYKGLIAGPSRLRSRAFTGLAGPAAEGCIVPQILAPAGTAKPEKSFIDLYRKHFKNEPDFLATASGDAAMFFAQLLRAAGERPPYRAFPLKQEFTGVSGNLKFDKDGNRLVTLGLMICRGGEFQPLDSHKR